MLRLFTFQMSTICSIDQSEKLVSDRVAYFDGGRSFNAIKHRSLKRNSDWNQSSHERRIEPCNRRKLE